MRKLLVLLCTMALLLSLSACVFAATVSYTDDLPAAQRSWSNVFLTLPKFDTNLGTLNSISLALTGKVNGVVRVENITLDPAVIETTIQATVTLYRPDSSTLVVSLPSLARTFNATAFDGTVDCVGTSGITYPETLIDKTESVIGLSSAADKALFSGAGSILLPVTAAGSASGSGSEDLLVFSAADCGAFARVTYDYTPVPEPSGLLALLSGVGGLAGLVVRRRK